MALFDYTDVFANSPMTGIADTFTFFKDEPSSKIVNSLKRTFKNCKNLQHLPEEDQPVQDTEGLTTDWNWFYKQCANVENMEEAFAGSGITAFPLMKPLPYLYTAKGCFKDCVGLKKFGLHAFLVSARIEDLSDFATNADNVETYLWPVLAADNLLCTTGGKYEDYAIRISANSLKTLENAFLSESLFTAPDFSEVWLLLFNCENSKNASIRGDAFSRIITYEYSKFYTNKSNTTFAEYTDGIVNTVSVEMNTLCRLVRVYNEASNKEEIYQIPANAYISKDMLKKDIVKYIPEAIKLCEFAKSDSDVVINIANSLAPDAWPVNGTIIDIYGYKMATIKDGSATFMPYNGMYKTEYLCDAISFQCTLANPRAA